MLKVISDLIIGMHGRQLLSQARFPCIKAKAMFQIYTNHQRNIQKMKSKAKESIKGNKLITKMMIFVKSESFMDITEEMIKS